MPQPLMIWTMRRSGGTSLSYEFREEFQRTTKRDEPFNADRDFGFIQRDFSRDQDVAKMKAAVATALESVDFVKHCVDLLPMALHEAIMAHTKAQGWRHLMLLRRREIQRMLSLEFAQVANIWDIKNASDQERLAQLKSGSISVPRFEMDRLAKSIVIAKQRRGWLNRQWRSLGDDAMLVHFEDIYLAQQSDWLPPILDHVGIPDDRRADFAARLTNRVHHGGQGTRALYDRVPNIAEARSLLQDAYA